MGGIQSILFRGVMVATLSGCVGIQAFNASKGVESAGSDGLEVELVEGEVGDLKQGGSGLTVAGKAITISDITDHEPYPDREEVTMAASQALYRVSLARIQPRLYLFSRFQRLHSLDSSMPPTTDGYGNQTISEYPLLAAGLFAQIDPLVWVYYKSTEYSGGGIGGPTQENETLVGGRIEVGVFALTSVAAKLARGRYPLGMSGEGQAGVGFDKFLGAYGFIRAKWSVGARMRERTVLVHSQEEASKDPRPSWMQRASLGIAVGPTLLLVADSLTGRSDRASGPPSGGSARIFVGGVARPGLDVGLEGEFSTVKLAASGLQCRGSGCSEDKDTISLATALMAGRYSLSNLVRARFGIGGTRLRMSYHDVDPFRDEEKPAPFSAVGMTVSGGLELQLPYKHIVGMAVWQTTRFFEPGRFANSLSALLGLHY